MAEAIIRRYGRSGEDKAVSQRVLRGVNLYAAKHEEIERVDKGVYKVPSCTREWKHTVRLFGGEERCTCRDYQMRGRLEGRLCLHIAAALIAESKRTEYRIERRHNSLLSQDEYALVEVRFGIGRVLDTYLYVGDAYEAKWELEGFRGAA